MNISQHVFVSTNESIIAENAPPGIEFDHDVVLYSLILFLLVLRVTIHSQFMKKTRAYEPSNRDE